MKNKKQGTKKYFKSWVEKLLTNVTLLIVFFIVITIESEGLAYWLIVLGLVCVEFINLHLLTKYGKEFRKDNLID